MIFLLRSISTTNPFSFTLWSFCSLLCFSNVRFESAGYFNLVCHPVYSFSKKKRNNNVKYISYWAIFISFCENILIRAAIKTFININIEGRQTTIYHKCRFWTFWKTGCLRKLCLFLPCQKLSQISIIRFAILSGELRGIKNMFQTSVVFPGNLLEYLFSEITGVSEPDFDRYLTRPFLTRLTPTA